jgi:hypothetical protein
MPAKSAPRPAPTVILMPSPASLHDLANRRTDHRRNINAAIAERKALGPNTRVGRDRESHSGGAPSRRDVPIILGTTNLLGHSGR